MYQTIKFIRLGVAAIVLYDRTHGGFCGTIGFHSQGGLALTDENTLGANDLGAALSDAAALIQQGRFDESERRLRSLPEPLSAEPAVRAQLSVIAAQLGRLDEAEAECRALLDAHPRADLACNLGLVLLKKGLDDQAMTVFFKALAMPACPLVAHKHAGRLLLKTDQPLLALEHFRTIEKAHPNDPENLTDTGFAILANQQFHEAEPLFRQALELSNRYSDAWHGLGQSLRGQNRVEEAVSAMRRAIEYTENTLAIEVDLAVLYETSNKIDEAAELADRVLERLPGEPHMMLLRARCERRSEQSGKATATLMALLESDNASEQQRSTAHQLLGRICDSAGQCDQAYSHFERSNRIAEALVGASPGEKNPYVAHVEQVRRWATPETLKSIATPIEPDPRLPVFLIGFPRSGTTLMDQVLDAHPRVQVMSEKPTVTAMQRDFRLRHHYPDDIASIGDAEIETLRSVYFDSVDQQLKRDDTAILIDKMPLNITAVPFIHKVFPGARYIVALRHPCDVCLSCFMQEFGPNVATLNFFSLEQIATMYSAVMSLWQNVSVLPLNVHQQRYEDLVDDFEGQSRALLDFLRLEFDPAILRFEEHARRRGHINTPSYDQVSQPLYQDARYRWTRYRSQLDPVMPMLMPFIEDFGYES